MAVGYKHIGVLVFISLYFVCFGQDNDNLFQPTGPVDYCKNKVENCYCSDTVIDCNEAKFTDLAELSPYINTSLTARVSITNGKLAEFSGFDTAGEKWDKLRFLNLSGNAISYINADAFQLTPNITILDLSNNPTGCISKVLKPLSQLQKLFARNVDSRSEHGEGGGSDKTCSPCEMVPEDELPSLQVLDLGVNRFTSMTPKFREFLCDKAYNLKSLDLSSNNFEHVPVDMCMTNLEYLDLSYNKIQNVNHTETEVMETLVNLKLARFEGNAIDCTCSLYYFQYWLNSTTQPLDFDQIVCVTSFNESLIGRHVKDLTNIDLCGEPEIIICYGPNGPVKVARTTFVLILVAVGFLVCVGTAAVVVLCRRRANKRRQKCKSSTGKSYIIPDNPKEPAYDRMV